jgi:predicted TPR repeat methyltransferase
MLDKARARHLYDELIEAELHAYLLTQSARFDAIVSADTLVYFGNLEAVIDGFHQALVPQGWLVFTVEHALPEDAPEGYCIHPHGRYSHTTRYVKRRLSESGFVDITAKRVTLRKEAGKWVDGLLVTARKPATL